MNRRLMVVLAVILPAICPVFPQVAQPFPRDRQDSTHIEGWITDRSGNPVQLARVVLSAFTSEMGQTSVSDDDGRFAFYGLKEGSYKITISAVGFKDRVQPVELTAGGQNLRIVLVDSGPRSPAPSGSPVTAKQLEIPEAALKEHNKGLEDLREKRYEDALKRFRAALRIFPEFPDAQSGIGLTYVQMQKLDEAQESFNKAIRLNSDNFDALMGLGLVSNDRKQFKEAEEWLLRARAVNSAAWQVHYELGRALYGLDRLPEAETSLTRARLSHPEYRNLYLTLANVLILQGKYAEGLQEMKQYMELAPQGKTADQVREKMKLIRKELASSSNKD